MSSLSSSDAITRFAVTIESPWARMLTWAIARRRDTTLNLILLWGIRVGTVLLFITPLVVTTGTVFPFIVGKAVWSRSLIEIIVGLYIILAIRAPDFRPMRSRLVLLLSAHVAAIFIAAVLGSSFNLSFWSNYERMGGVFDLTHWVALATVLIFTMGGLREWKNLASISLIFGLVAAFLGLAEKYDYEVVEYLQNGNRISGAAGNPSFLAGHMMVNVLIALALLGDAVTGSRKSSGRFATALPIFYVLSAAISLWVLSETGTRGSAAGLLAGLVVAAALYAVFSGRPRIRLAAKIAGIAVPVAVIGLFLARDAAFVENLAARNELVDRVVSMSVGDGSAGLRATGLRIATEAFIGRPISGLGGENFEVAYQRYQRLGEMPPGTPVFDRAHNKPMNLLATTGVIGFSTYVGLWGWIGVLSWRRIRRDSANRGLHVGIAGALVALLIHEMFLFDTAVTMLLFVLLIVWAAGGERRGTTSAVSIEGRRTLPPHRRKALRWAASATVVLAVAALLIGVNWRMYRSAQLITNTGANVAEVAANLDHFSPLGTYGRERLLNVISDRWQDFDGFDRIEMIPQLELVAEQALSAEPHNMELHFAVARFYRAAASTVPELMDRARFHTDRGTELGPNTGSSRKALAAQSSAEDALSSESPRG